MRSMHGDDGESHNLTMLFINGIPDSVGSYQVKDLFAKYGKVSSVFVQRLEKHGRVFNFGFSRFVSRGCAFSIFSAYLWFAYVCF